VHDPPILQLDCRDPAHWLLLLDRNRSKAT
jgi:hypothetical protein